MVEFSIVLLVFPRYMVDDAKPYLMFWWWWWWWWWWCHCFGQPCFCVCDLFCFECRLCCQSVRQPFWWCTFKWKKNCLVSKDSFQSIYTGVWNESSSRWVAYTKVRPYSILYTIKPVLIFSEFCWYILWNRTYQVDVFNTWAGQSLFFVLPWTARLLRGAWWFWLPKDI